jgi:hypothetical protein
MAAPRRYRIGQNPKYDKSFDAYKGDSPVLNPRSSGIGVNALNLNDANSLESHLLERIGFQGDPKIMKIGYFRKGETGQLQISDLKSAEMQIREIKSQFKNEQQSIVNQGRNPPKEMSKDLKDKLLRAEARHDIVQSEISTLERLLKNFVDQDKKIDDSKVLKGGPRGMGKLRHGVLVHVDGQNVEADSKGILRIADPRSRYNGMKTADYYDEIVRPWIRANSNLLKEHGKKARASMLTDPDFDIGRAPKAPWPDVPKEAA